jgi:murein DD-endopeptidase MepM/ murein hydrolase activator NlpD
MSRLEEILLKHQHTFAPVVPFNAVSNKLLLMDFTAANNLLTNEVLRYTPAFTRYVEQQLANAGALYGIGGYDEHRTIYARSEVFGVTTSALQDGINVTEEPRRLHLGIDIWGQADTPIYAPLGGIVHSFAFNDAYGDYGATIILQHQLDTMVFHTLYGHLSLKDLHGLQEGRYIAQGALLAHFGVAEENGYWPPHLHFQIIHDMGMKKGDYPGVCKYSERTLYLANCLNPDLILQMMKYVE